MSKSAIAVLQEYCQKKNLPIPVYNIVDQNSGTHMNTFTMRVTCDKFNADATSSTKKGAKHDAAAKMIKLLKEKNYPIEFNETPISITPIRNVEVDLNDIAVKVEVSPGCNMINSVGMLQELCAKNKLKSPKYHEHIVGISNGFQIDCILGDIKTTAVGLSKKQAKQDCAEKMRQLLLKSNVKLAKSSEDNDSLSDSNLVELHFENLRIETDPLVQQSTERAKNLFPELTKVIPIGVTKYGDVSFNNLHSILKNSMNSDKLKRFHLYFSKLNFDTIKPDVDTLGKVLQNICEILNITANKKYLIVGTKRANTHAVAYELNTVPPVAEVGIGESALQAQILAMTRTIRTINLLLM